MPREGRTGPDPPRHAHDNFSPHRKTLRGEKITIHRSQDSAIRGNQITHTASSGIGPATHWSFQHPESQLAPIQLDPQQVERPGLHLVFESVISQAWPGRQNVR